MSASHKAALAEGRAQGRAVRRYLEALEANKPRRGRKRTPESIRRQLARNEEAQATADPLRKVHLIQQRLDLEAHLKAMEESTDISALEKEFIAAAKAYSERKGITYGAWRQAGVPQEVLAKAGIGRGG